jgi:Domain of unknown function (DUF4386)
MSFNEAPWGKFVARSALLLGVAGLALMVIFIAVLPVDPSDPNAELVAAARNPAMYRLAALLDMLAWFGIGGVLLAFGGYFAARAPVRALVLAAAGAGQVVGALGGYMRLGVVSDLAVRYVTASPDQRAAIEQAFVSLPQVVASHYGAGQWLYGIGYLLVASLAFSHGGVPRWIAVWFAIAGIYSVANQLSVVAVGALLPGLLFLVFMLGQDLLALAMAITFWRGAAPAARIAPAPAV